MIRYYFPIALRNIRRHKGYSFINIAGLTLGLACCLVIFQYVAFERSFDRFHENEDDLYRVIRAGARMGEEIESGGTFTPQALGPVLASAVPEIRHFARVHMNEAVVARPELPDRVFEEDAMLYVDPAFLEMFSFPLVAGSAEQALERGTLALTESAARKYFGDENPIGRQLDVAGEVHKTYRIGGVLQDVPANSHLQFDFLFPMDDLLLEGRYTEEPEDGWSWNNFATYVQLHAGTDRSAAESKILEVYDEQRRETLAERGFVSRPSLQPLRDVYLNADIHSFIGLSGNYRTVYFFTIIGLVTLLIALVNYVNLATARALDRAREVGVRKTVGAQRRQLIEQFLFESAFIILVAAALAVVLSIWLMPIVNQHVGTQLGAALWSDPAFWFSFGVTLVICTLLSGLYPAFVLSSFRPSVVLKGKQGSFGWQNRLRRGLVIAQFSAAVVLMGGTAVVYHQLNYMRGMDLGIDLEQVITVPGPRVVGEGVTFPEARQIFVEEVRRLGQVRDVASSWAIPGQGFNWNGASVWRAELDETSSVTGRVTWVDTNFVSLYDLELIAGRGFSDISPGAEIASPFPYLTTESTVQALGFTTPEEAIGHPLRLGTGNPFDIQIVGVLRDFNWSSAHEERDLALLGFTWAGPNLSIRAATQDLSATIASIEALYIELFPGNVFQYGFADEAFGRQYLEDQRFASLFTLFAGLAIAIACLGLFGLAAFTTRQRTKEIGVRKVLGATVSGLTARLSFDFLKLVLIAIFIASPIAYFLMQRWLEGFAYRVDVGPGLFLLVGTIALLTAFLTVASQSIRAALTDPVKSLRSE